MKISSCIIAVLVGMLLGACTCGPTKNSIRVDGSSTVYVISEAVAEEYQKNSKQRVSIGVSGTGGGFKKLCSDRVAMIGASRAITKNEEETCKKNNISWAEFEVALDGIAIVVNKENHWLDSIDVDVLKKMFEPGAEGKILLWSHLNPKWPQEKLAIYAPGVSSGTYDYFTKAMVGKAHASRGDITTSEDDNVLVHGVRSNKFSIGFFSYAYYLENKDHLKLLGVGDKKNNRQAVFPSYQTIRNQTYEPLSRPVFVYVNTRKLDSSFSSFVEFYLNNSSNLASDVGFIPLAHQTHQQNLLRFNQLMAGLSNGAK